MFPIVSMGSGSRFGGVAWWWGCGGGWLLGCGVCLPVGVGGV